MADQKKGSKHFDFTKDNNSGGGRFDFTKDQPEKSHFQKFGKWYGGGAFAAICVAAAVAFWPKSEVLPPVVPPVDSLQQVVDTPAVVRVDSVVAQEEPTVDIDEISDGPGAEPAPKEPQGSEVNIVAPSESQCGDVTIDAKKAIRGDLGNGAERRKNLGNNYDKVQAVVNKMYREGNLKW